MNFQIILQKPGEIPPYQPEKPTIVPPEKPTTVPPEKPTIIPPEKPQEVPEPPKK